jgi:putative oxidoreductase
MPRDGLVCEAVGVHRVDLALLALRLAIGVTVALHGLNKIKGGLANVARWFESMGMRPGSVHARLAAFTETGAGLALAAGFLTPLAAGGLVGVMMVAGLIAHRGHGFFIFRPGEGWEYVLVLGVCSAAVGTLGPGEWSLDNAIDFMPTGWWPALFCFVGAPLIALAVLSVFYRPPVKEAP